MAKKRRRPTEEQNINAAPSTQRAGSRHKPRKMIAFDPSIYDLLRQLAEKNQRPLSWEARLMAIERLKENGLWPPKN